MGYQGPHISPRQLRSCHAPHLSPAEPCPPFVLYESHPLLMTPVALCSVPALQVSGTYVSGLYFQPTFLVLWLLLMRGFTLASVALQGCSSCCVEPRAPSGLTQDTSLRAHSCFVSQIPHAFY